MVARKLGQKKKSLVSVLKIRALEQNECNDKAVDTKLRYIAKNFMWNCIVSGAPKRVELLSYSSHVHPPGVVKIGIHVQTVVVDMLW